MTLPSSSVEATLAAALRALEKFALCGSGPVTATWLSKAPVVRSQKTVVKTAMKSAERKTLLKCGILIWLPQAGCKSRANTRKVRGQRDVGKQRRVVS